MTSKVGVNKPRVGGGNRSSSSSRLPTKRTRQVSSIHQMIPTVDEGDNEDDEKTAETATDNISTSASEASSKASNSSQPQLQDFIGATCMASAWFTSCFPCAVVDINDTDDYVVDKLSRESAMNVMYANNNNNNTVPVSPDNSLQRTSTPQSTPEREQERQARHP